MNTGPRDRRPELDLQRTLRIAVQTILNFQHALEAHAPARHLYGFSYTLLRQATETLAHLQKLQAGEVGDDQKSPSPTPFDLDDDLPL